MPTLNVSRQLAAVLFDLDGTLIDSAPDLAGAANDMRVTRGLPCLALAHFRPMVGSGARGMLSRAFDIDASDTRYPAMRDEFLECYQARMTRETRIFPKILPVLRQLQSGGIPWGIVTNKATRFSVPLVRAMGLHTQVATLICGDSTPHCKPHPEPLLEAARRMKVSPRECVYVGDDLRDAQAGRAAGMLTVAAGWGYLGSGEAIECWGADHVIHSPTELLNRLGMA